MLGSLNFFLNAKKEGWGSTNSLACHAEAHNPATAGSRVQIPPPQPSAMNSYASTCFKTPNAVFTLVLAKMSMFASSNIAGMSRSTRSKGPWRIVWQSDALTLPRARALERELKRQKGGNGFYQKTGLQ